jgi:uncharacterized protein (TIGR00725 family)
MIQIGVMGSAADLRYPERFERIAEEIGAAVAKAGCILVYGAEQDYDSLSTAAARGAKAAGGLTVGVTYGREGALFDPHVTDVIIRTGMDRGGGREFVLVSSCDVIIAIGGGSGTLTEIAIAYQANRPIVVIESSGGWSEELAGRFLDGRERMRIESARTPEQAVSLALKLAKNAQRR